MYVAVPAVEGAGLFFRLYEWGAVMCGVVQFGCRRGGAGAVASEGID